MRLGAAGAIALALLLSTVAAAAQTCTLPISIVPKEAGLAAVPGISMIVVAQPAGVRVVSLAPAPPARVLLLIDASGSMNHEHRWPAARADAQALIQAAPAGVQMGVVAFADNPRLVAGFAAPASLLAALAAGFTNHKPYGGTAFYDAVVESADYFLRQPDGARGDVIIALSDGDDNSSRRTIVQIVELLQRRGERLFLLGNPGAEGVSVAAHRLAEQTGGAVRKVSGGRSPKDAAKDAHWFWDLLARQYMLTIGYTGAISSELELRPAAGAGVSLLYPHTLAICAPPAAAGDGSGR